jgi:hypothetical protein
VKIMVGIAGTNLGSSNLAFSVVLVVVVVLGN